MSYTLTYFDCRGLMEPTRILFAIAKHQLNEVRLPIDFVTYARPEMEVLKAAGELTANMDRLPILVCSDGTTIGQSKTIERYAAKKLGMDICMYACMHIHVCI